MRRGDVRTRRPEKLRAARAAAVCASLLCLVLAGCDGLEYVTHVVQGQLAIQGRTEPIEDVLASGRLSAEEAEKLRLVVAARRFAVEVIGLHAGDAYTTFYDTAGDPLAFNLSAARRDALVPYVWVFPIAGEFPYLGFFDEAYMRRVEQGLIAEGYDTFAYEVDAYSTLGLFGDPVRSTMLRRDTLSLAETVIHELLHNTVWRAGDVVFNESLATFVGQQGAIDFLRHEFGDESGWPELAAACYADVAVVNGFLLDLYRELEAYYAQPISAEARISGRESVYQSARERFAADIWPRLNYPDVFAGYAELPTNNAWMLANYRYNLDLDVFAAVYEALGADWPAALEVYQAAARSADDPFAYLRRWLADHGL